MINKSILALTIALLAGVAHAEYIIKMPIESSAGGSLPNKSIAIVDLSGLPNGGVVTPEPTTPTQPTEPTAPVEEPPHLLNSIQWTVDENIEPWLSGSPYGLPQIVQNKDFSGIVPSVSVYAKYDAQLDKTKTISVAGKTCTPTKGYEKQNGVDLIYFICDNTVLIPFNTPEGTKVKADFYDK